MPRTVKEWIGKTDNAMPPKTVFDRLYDKQGGKDAITGLPFTVKDKIVRDHIIPLIDGGRNCESNLQLITVETHALKTGSEATQRGHERRVRARARGYDMQRPATFQGSNSFPPARPRKSATTPHSKQIGVFIDADRPTKETT